MGGRGGNSFPIDPPSWHDVDYGTSGSAPTGSPASSISVGGSSSLHFRTLGDDSLASLPPPSETSSDLPLPVSGA